MNEQKLQRAFGTSESEKQNKPAKEVVLSRKASFKGLGSERNSLDHKHSNRETMRNGSLPPLEHSRSSISVRKESFSSNSESVLKA